jgi:uncharacterized protein DUF29
MASSNRAVKVAEKPRRKAASSASYEQDFFAWSFEQARVLRAVRPAALDWENLAEEVESLGSSIRHAVRSKLTVIVSHLLKLKYQPKKRSPSWLASIATQRADVQALLEESPSLRQQVPGILVATYRTASRVASFEMGWSKREKRMLPDECPFTVEQVLDDEFFPD